jgi:hypothetical protein
MGNDICGETVLDVDPLEWKLAARVQLETVALFSRRAQAYLAFADTLVVSPDPQELFDGYVQFWQTAQHHYMECFNAVVGVTAAKNKDVEPLEAVPTVQLRVTRVARPSVKCEQMPLASAQPIAIKPYPLRHVRSRKTA